MTVRLLREVLDEMSVTYSKNLKKADLVKKVREARKERLSDNVGDSASRPSKSSGVGSARSKDRTCKNGKNIGQPVLVLCYFDEKKKDANCSIYVTLQTIGHFLYLSIYQYLFTVLSTIYMVINMLEIIYAALVLIHLIQLLLANALCVRINQELLFCDSSNINVLLHEFKLAVFC